MAVVMKRAVSVFSWKFCALRGGMMKVCNFGERERERGKFYNFGKMERWRVREGEREGCGLRG